MDMALAGVVARLKEKEDYPKLFQAAFGRDVNAEDLAQALASYLRTILSGDSPYDRYVSGERKALSAEARHGLELFRGKAPIALPAMSART
jgi:cytochrome c peroxidase